MLLKKYDGNSIEVLEGLEPVKKRPGMYIGSTGIKGLHHLVWEIIDNGVDEYLAGYCTQINVSLNEDGSITVEDNGRGIPVDLHKKGIVTERIIFTTLHAGGKFNRDSYKVSGGLHGVGASVVNALSSYLKVEVFRDGYHYVDEYRDGGIPITPLNDKGLLDPVGKTEKTGTRITFIPSSEIFETTKFRPDIIKRRLKEIAFLNKGLTLVYENHIDKEKEIYHEEDGIIGFIKELNKGKNIITDPIYLSGEKDNIWVEVALQYAHELGETILSFCNNINTTEGGTHVSGLKAALTRVINNYARELGQLKDKDANFDGRDVRQGLIAVISIKHPNPQFEGQTKTKLGNSDARTVCEEIIAREAEFYFDKNLEVLNLVIQNALKAYNLRKTEEKVRNNFLNKNNAFVVNGKLAACQSKNPKENELFIVEGDSAGGSAKQARNRRFQAILPLRGKVLNVEKNNVSKILDNEEISTLIMALGCGFGEGYGDDFDINKLKYDKVIILTDADVDGSHIRTLLLTFFYRFMPELIYNGKVYIGMPPLYLVSDGKEKVYLYNERELEEYKRKHPNKKFTIQRYKGLGEMNPEQLWETTLNPETRYLKRVSIEDAYQADMITSLLMGSEVTPRKEFIYQEALNATIDV